jgi:hypothetical protein
MLIIPAILEAEIGRIAVQAHPGKKVCETPSQGEKARYVGAHLSSQPLQEVYIGGSWSRSA